MANCLVNLACWSNELVQVTWILGRMKNCWSPLLHRSATARLYSNQGKRLSGWIIGSPEKITSQIQGPNVLIDTWANFKYNRRKSRPSVKMDLDSSSVLSSVVLQNPHGVLHTQSACFGHITSYRVPSSRHISCTMYTSCTIQPPPNTYSILETL